MKNFFAVILFVAAFGGFFLFKYTKDTRESLAEDTEQLEGQEKMVNARQKEFDTIVNALELQRQAVEKHKVLAGIQAEQQSLDQQIGSLQTRKKKQVTVDRQVLIGTVLSNVTLNDGRKFPEVRISKIDDTSVSFTVPSGIVKVKPSDLPPEVRQVLQYP